MTSVNQPLPKHALDDEYPTKTSALQRETEDILQAHVAQGAPTLDRSAHLQFLIRNLVQGFPARYISQDASQPWLMYWTLQSFSVLQVAVDPVNKQRAIDTIMAWQHPDGGFAGGSGQAAHLLPTYASICSLAIVGRPGPGGGWDQIDREKLYKLFMSLKQPDGSFIVSEHGEVDVRGIYCLLVSAYLVDILTPELIEDTAAFIASCQTYEGGFASASHPYYAAQEDKNTPLQCISSPRPNLGEAHGGYTYCALAAWVLLKPFLPEEGAPSIDVKRLLRWAVNMQGSETEVGGFRGRTNKLIDGCYSWWGGGEFALLEALGVSGHREHAPLRPQHEAGPTEEWVGSDDSVFNRDAMQRFILLTAQHPAGGLRDKPPKHPDAYHTLYCLAGLSVAQHRVTQSPARRSELRSAWTPKPEIKYDMVRKTAFTEALCWSEEEGSSIIIGPASNRVNASHPLFNLTMTHSEGIMAHFYKQTLPKRFVRAPPKVA
ncbi:terpenoid cyclases/Protein prenyltransferase [Vararia minispora EC-137]|uniref:Terpenoid cyclases/Protein prenyltransferase n=1 Tax=Vararia minispora EC-137 TaxID=1314806 RepID=A0ACB8QV06_9AGAM|nr:terpenoid cyclases/Protein prenyltransferase [Vararia minispora EC-137]